MKKIYSKPEIMFEDFTLSINIAAGCDTKVEGANSGDCGYETGGLVVFLEGVTGCTGLQIPEGAEGAFNFPCYHVPDSDTNLFNS
ncbi:MAG: hypothetical protein IJN77_08380 [Oscillospiraceae bacterium]|nr:hypothetical protein [Oscillospiraceae bacterium]